MFRQIRSENVSMKRITFLMLSLAMGALITGCGRDFQTPSIDESGNETGVDVAPDRTPASLDSSIETRTLALDQSTNIRKLSNGVLEFVAELPPGSLIMAPVDYQISQPDVRNSNGTVSRSSTGFVGSIKIVSTPTGARSLSSVQITAFNKIKLYVSASVIGATEGVDGTFKIITGNADGAGYSALFQSNGKPKFQFTSGLARRFGSKVNKAVDAASVDVVKSQKILNAMAFAANRKKATPKSLILIDEASAKRASLAYEATGTIATNGAWSIAVDSTAVRHGFENVPCAEFMSEMIREAYQRAGYALISDFSSARGNQLIWSKTASVVGLSDALHVAGWVAWEPSKFRPPIGAVMMHGPGLSPGHTFMSGGDDGRIIIDNGSPQGRDLRTTSASTLNMMYKNGVFFLPPGLTPKSW